jgi:hypothetical protein
VDKKSKDIKKADKSAKPTIAEPPAPVLSRAASKKDMVEPKLAKKVSAKTDRVLDLCLLLDCTGSMASWIKRSKDTLKEIIDNVKRDNPELQVRVCFVGYRDI